VPQQLGGARAALAARPATPTAGDALRSAAGQLDREALVRDHMHLARRVAGRFAHRGETGDDLGQVAMIGLIKAAERFDPDRGVQFVTYATATMLGELKRHFRDNRWWIHVPRSVQTQYLAVREAVEILTQQLHRSPTVPEIARFAQLGNEEVLEAIEAGRSFHPASLDLGADDNDGRVELSSVDSGLAEVEDRQSALALVAHLAQREQAIVRLRFFEQMTQSEIAAHLGLSQMHVSRLLARSLEKLRALVESGTAG
jgi:RNA polymerase sigma-B factor